MKKCIVVSMVFLMSFGMAQAMTVERMNAEDEIGILKDDIDRIRTVAPDIDVSTLSYATLDTALVQLLNTFDVTNDAHVSNFVAVYGQLRDVLDQINHFLFKAKVFNDLISSFTKFKTKLPTWADQAQAAGKAGNIMPVFLSYRDYIQRYFIEAYLADLHANKAEVLQTKAKYQAFGLEILDFLNEDLLPPELIDKLPVDAQQDAEQALELLKAKEKEIEALIGFDENKWPQMLAQLDDAARQEALNRVEAVMIKAEPTLTPEEMERALTELSVTLTALNAQV